VGSKRLRLRIRGQVQGVSFRWYARQRAISLGLSGWVRNCPDGSVEAVVEGPADAVGSFASWARRGPAMASVDVVDAEVEAAIGDTSPFSIRH
jgi:acylphosphatase